MGPHSVHFLGKHNPPQYFFLSPSSRHDSSLHKLFTVKEFILFFFLFATIYKQWTLLRCITICHLFLHWITSLLVTKQVCIKTGNNLVAIHGQLRSLQNSPSDLFLLKPNTIKLMLAVLSHACHAQVSKSHQCLETKFYTVL